jgi:hypothetical protein
MTTSPQARRTYSAGESDANVLWATQSLTPDPFIVTQFHEAPGTNCRNHTMLKTGHVATVESELYYSGMGGVRLEDVVLATKTGCKSPARTPKALEV